MEHAKPQAEHQWLDQMLGEWTFDSEMDGGPGNPPMRTSGQESVRSLGGLWVLCEMESEMPGGGTGRMIISLGFDPAKGRFVGTFIGSMMTNLWVYDGALDPGRKALTLNAEGPSFSGDGTMANYQDIITIVGPNERLLESQVQLPDGKWQKFMKATYRRKA